MTAPKYDGTPVRRTFNDQGKATGFSVPPNLEWDDRDVVLWSLSLVNTETGLNIGAQGPDKDGKYIVTGEFLTGTFPPTDATGVVNYLLGVLSGYVASSHGFGVLGAKPAPSAAFPDLFGGLFR